MDPTRLPMPSRSADGLNGAMHRLTLHFADPALERRYRLAHDAHAVRLLRLALLWGAAIFLAGGAGLHLFVPVSVLGGANVPLMAFISAATLSAGYAVTFAPWVVRHPQAAVASLAVLLAPPTVEWLRHMPAEFVTNRGFLFMLFQAVNIFGLLRLRMVPATAAAWLSLVGYAWLARAWGLMDDVSLLRQVFWLVIGNIWGVLICWQLEASSRRAFVAQEGLEAERARAEGLLLNILPAQIADRLKNQERPIADHAGEVTVLFADIVGFTPLSARLQAGELVELLDRIFSRFDALAREHGLEKIKTIGDAYMAVAGLPLAQADHAARAARMGLALVRAVDDIAADVWLPLQVRVGLHTGPVVAGVIGRSKFSYDLWGDTVNTASRMESHGIAGHVHCSEATAAALGEGIVAEARDAIEVKGKGAMQTFVLRDARAATRAQLSTAPS